MAEAGERGARREQAAVADDAAKAAADEAAARAKQAKATGRRLDGARMGLRNSMIIARNAQGVPWKDIAREAGISARAAQRVVEQAREARSPVDEAPMRLLEDLADGFRRSISDYEAMAHAWFETNQSAALGAKKAADDTRDRLANLLADVGKLPSNLELFRSEMEMQRIAEQMGETLIGLREGTITVDDAIEFFRDLVATREQAALPAGG